MAAKANGHANHPSTNVTLATAMTLAMVRALTRPCHLASAPVSPTMRKAKVPRDPLEAVAFVVNQRRITRARTLRE